MLEINIILTHKIYKIYISVAILKKKVMIDELRLESGFVFFNGSIRAFITKVTRGPKSGRSLSRTLPLGAGALLLLPAAAVAGAGRGALPVLRRARLHGPQQRDHPAEPGSGGRGGRTRQLTPAQEDPVRLRRSVPSR